MPIPATEQLNQASTGLDVLPAPEVARRIHAAQMAALAVVGGACAEIAAAGELMARTLRAGGRLVYAAAGSSALMALADAAELPGTFGIEPGRISILMAGGLPVDARMPGHTEDDVDAARRAAAGITSADALIAVSASGTTAYPLTLARIARQRGARTICIANNEGAPLLAQATVAICLPTPSEIVAGSTRMGAGTAQKAALNMMSTVMGIALGHVYDGMMVNLAADNDKLRARSAAMVARIAGVGPDQARMHLSAAAGAVKPAVLLAAGATSFERAMELLEETKGHLRAALARL